MKPELKHLSPILWTKNLEETNTSYETVLGFRFLERILVHRQFKDESFKPMVAKNIEGPNGEYD